MDTYVENAGAAEQEKQIQVVPMENEHQIQVPVENVDTAGTPLDDENTAVWNSQGEELAQNINIVRAEKPDPLGRKTTNLPVNKIKAGYGYAFGKSGKKR